MRAIINDRLHTMATEYSERVNTQLNNPPRSRSLMREASKTASMLMRESQDRIEKVEKSHSPIGSRSCKKDL
jgi:hypothetical protein